LEVGIIHLDFQKRHVQRVLSKPWVVSLLITAVSFLISLLTIKMGYGVNDDIVMISIVSGAFGKASEFMVHSNVLWGLLLKLFYQFPTSINWEIVLFVLIDLLSLWALLSIVLSVPTTKLLKTLFLIAVLIGNGYFLLDISFTAIAAISASAGFSLVFFHPQREKKLLSFPSVSGIGLILISSLIRNISTLMIAVLFFPVILMNLRYFLVRRSFFPLLMAAFLVAGGVFFNKIYVELSPSWNTFYSYNYAHAQLINTPHFENSKGIVASVGWTQNDYDLMYSWFFPDGATFSPEKMLSLVNDSSGFAGSGSVIQEFQTRIFTLTVFPYLLLLGLGALTVIYSTRDQKALLTLLIVFFTPILILFILAFTQKVVNYVTIPLLMGSICLEFLLCGFFSKQDKEPNPVLIQSSLERIILMITILITFLVGAGANTYSLFQSSKNNLNHQIAYEQILTQLDKLQSTDDFKKDAQIFDLSGSGIPWEWSNPWTLQFPKLPIQIMGWLTFSPPFNKSVSQLGVSLLPDALYQKDNVYLVTEPGITPYIEKYFQEHDGIQVKSVPISDIQSTDSWIYRFEIRQ